MRWRGRSPLDGARLSRAWPRSRRRRSRRGRSFASEPLGVDRQGRDRIRDARQESWDRQHHWLERISCSISPHHLTALTDCDFLNEGRLVRESPCISRGSRPFGQCLWGGESNAAQEASLLDMRWTRDRYRDRRRRPRPAPCPRHRAQPTGKDGGPSPDSLPAEDCVIPLKISPGHAHFS